LKLTGDRSVSEDLVQEVFLRILKYRHSYHPETPFRAWMYQIARNARVDHFRKKRPETPLEPEMAPAVVPNDLTQEQQQAELLHRALLELTEDKREVLVLSRFQGLKYEQIAEVMDCEVNTVKVRVHRALHDLREIYQAMERGQLLRNARTKVKGQRPSSGSLQ
jgi:RNA polymerase sigma factor (sigma-70 family)